MPLLHTDAARLTPATALPWLALLCCQYVISEYHVVSGRAANGVLGVQVRMLIGLIRKVTGVTISAFFKQKDGYKYSGHKMEMPWHSKSGFGHKIRKYRMR